MDKQLAETLFAAYRQGLLRAPKPRSWEAQGRQFDFLFRQVLWKKIPIRERLLIWKIWNLGAKGLSLSRQGSLGEASEIFSSCWQTLESFDLSEKGALLATPPLESAHAYFEYKRREFEIARARILNAMEIDLQLENDEDFILLELHRVQSAQNLMRIDLQAGEPTRAISLAGEILAYIDGLCPRLSVHHSWQHHKLITSIPISLRQALIPQVANEVALALTYHPAEYDLEQKFLANVHIEEYLRRAHVLHEQFRRWLLAKRSFHQENWEQYLQQMLEFLPMGRADIGPLWYSTMIDILSFCRKLDTRIAMSLHDAILRDTQKWPSLPACFSAKLELEKLYSKRYPSLRSADTVPHSLKEGSA